MSPKVRLKLSLRNLTITSMLLAILLVQEYAMIAIPNVQLTFVLLMVYAAVLPFVLLMPLVVSYVLLDNLIMGTMNPLYLVPAVLAWSLWVLGSKFFAGRKLWINLFFGTLFGFIYGWFFIPTQMFLYGIDQFWPYLIADLPFDIILAINSFLTIFLLYRPLRRVLGELWNPNQEVFDFPFD
jgi:energy-coupling factor transport system substrate-specific component